MYQNNRGVSLSSETRPALCSLRLVTKWHELIEPSCGSGKAAKISVTSCLAWPGAWKAPHSKEPGSAKGKASRIRRSDVTFIDLDTMSFQVVQVVECKRCVVENKVLNFLLTVCSLQGTEQIQNWLLLHLKNGGQWVKGRRKSFNFFHSFNTFLVRNCWKAIRRKKQSQLLTQILWGVLRRTWRF